jgi:transcriptional regulator with XRE-family HTH domain
MSYIMSYEKPSIEARAEQLLKMVRTGDYLKELRTAKGYSLKDACDRLSLSTTYLSEIERGLKAPSDYLIRELAEFYGINENTLFDMLGKVPLAIIEELKSNANLKELILTVRNQKDLSDERKYEIYENLFRVYRSMIDS